MMSAVDPELGNDAKWTVGLPLLSLDPQISADHLCETIARKATEMPRIVKSALPPTYLGYCGLESKNRNQLRSNPTVLRGAQSAH